MDDEFEEQADTKTRRLPKMAKVRMRWFFAKHFL